MIVDFYDFYQINESGKYSDLKTTPKPGINNIQYNYNKIVKASNVAISLLKGKNVLGGKTFLIEIAMAESILGTDKGSNRTHGNAGRGPWQIDLSAFNETKHVGGHSILKTYHNILKKNGANWKYVQWNDCNTFLWGAVASRLYLAIKPFKISENRVVRAQQWKKYYNTHSGKGKAEEYWNRVQRCYKLLNLKDPHEGLSYKEALKKYSK
jgi:hypothetical protein